MSKTLIKMKNNQIKKIENTVHKICDSDYDSDEIAALLMWIRPGLQENTTLFDLSNFVAHSDVRDRGGTFDNIYMYIKNFIEVSENGGKIIGPAPLFISDSIIDELVIVLKSYTPNADSVKIIKQKERIVECLQIIMDDIEFSFSKKDSRIVKCYLKKENNKVYFCLNLSLKGPRIITSPSATIQASLFG